MTKAKTLEALALKYHGTASTMKEGGGYAVIVKRNGHQVFYIWSAGRESEAIKEAAQTL